MVTGYTLSALIPNETIFKIFITTRKTKEDEGNGN